MGANYEGQEQAITLLRNMPAAAREFVTHHMRNALAGAIGNIALAKLRTHEPDVVRHLNLVDECLDHAVQDLKAIGC